MKYTKVNMAHVQYVHSIYHISCLPQAFELEGLNALSLSEEYQNIMNCWSSALFKDSPLELCKHKRVCACMTKFISLYGCSKVIDDQSSTQKFYPVNWPLYMVAITTLLVVTLRFPLSKVAVRCFLTSTSFGRGPLGLAPCLIGFSFRYVCSLHSPNKSSPRSSKHTKHITSSCSFPQA